VFTGVSQSQEFLKELVLCSPIPFGAFDRVCHFQTIVLAESLLVAAEVIAKKEQVIGV
jgi:hypothetical protein